MLRYGKLTINVETSSGCLPLEAASRVNSLSVSISSEATASSFAAANILKACRIGVNGSSSTNYT